MTKTLYNADYDEDDPKRKSSRPTAGEGHRLVRLFLSIERADLREEILNFVEEILRRQDRGQSSQLPRAASLSQIGVRSRPAHAARSSARWAS
jgi:hypothetical protein